MKPAWDSLAQEYASSDKVVVADVDCTAEGKDLCERFGVQGFPTIYFFPADDNTKGVSYDGDRDVDGFVKFIEKNRKSSPSGANKEEL